jgi:hypothetical protein
VGKFYKDNQGELCDTGLGGGCQLIAKDGDAGKDHQRAFLYLLPGLFLPGECLRKRRFRR